MSFDRDVWVTGIGLVSTLGEGAVLTHEVLTSERSVAAGPAVSTVAGLYPVHPLCSLDFSRQIPSRAEQRQMGSWQRTGTYAAGLALADGGVTCNVTLLDRMDLVVSAGNGERDMSLDRRVLEGLRAEPEPGRYLNETLASGLRPTLYLGELSNLLAGNIQIVHKVTGSSRTFKGEEMAGVSAIEDAWRRIGAGQSEIALVGGALNAEREDLLLGYELGCNLWRHRYAPVWRRRDAGGGFIPGSAGAFLVIEASDHARDRGAKPYARLTRVASDRSSRAPGAAGATLASLIGKVTADLPDGPVGVLSGASGVEPVTSEELAVLRGLAGARRPAAVRAYGSRLGHTVEAHMPLGVALGALAVSRGSFYPPFDDSGVEQPLDRAPATVLVTSVGHWRGEGVVRLDPIVGEATR